MFDPKNYAHIEPYSRLAGLYNTDGTAYVDGAGHRVASGNQFAGFIAESLYTALAKPENQHLAQNFPTMEELLAAENNLPERVRLGQYFSISRLSTVLPDDILKKVLPVEVAVILSADGYLIAGLRGLAYTNGRGLPINFGGGTPLTTAAGLPTDAEFLQAIVERETCMKIDPAQLIKLGVQDMDNPSKIYYMTGRNDEKIVGFLPETISSYGLQSKMPLEQIIASTTLGTSIIALAAFTAAELEGLAGFEEQAILCYPGSAEETQKFFLPINDELTLSMIQDHLNRDTTPLEALVASGTLGDAIVITARYNKPTDGGPIFGDFEKRWPVAAATMLLVTGQTLGPNCRRLITEFAQANNLPRLLHGAKQGGHAPTP